MLRPKWSSYEDIWSEVNYAHNCTISITLFKKAKTKTMLVQINAHNFICVNEQIFDCIFFLITDWVCIDKSLRKLYNYIFFYELCKLIFICILNLIFRKYELQNVDGLTAGEYIMYEHKKLPLQVGDTLIFWSYIDIRRFCISTNETTLRTNQNL